MDFASGIGAFSHITLPVTQLLFYHHIAAQTTSEPPHVSLLEPGIPDYRLPWMFSTCKLFLMWGKE
jgi:hypothetical protein